MAYTKNMNYNSISNVGISARFKQVLILIAAIVFGIIISATVSAIPSSKINVSAGVQNAMEAKK